MRLSESSGTEKEDRPMWTKPAFTDLRIGFEVTMYFANR
jgi:pyrroloquinoline quinone biosynthesis protein A